MTRSLTVSPQATLPSSSSCSTKALTSSRPARCVVVARVAPTRSTDVCWRVTGQQMKDTPLIRAAHNGHLQTVMYLVEMGADVDTIDLVRRQAHPSRRPSF